MNTTWRPTRRPRPARQGSSGRTQRLSWGLADQAVSSLTNFVVVIFVARSLGPREFGIFSLAYVTYSFTLTISRGLATDPLVVRFSGVSHESWRAAVRTSAGTATAVGCGIGAVSVVVGLAVGGAIGPAFLALGIVLPGMLLQDCWRYAFFAAGKGHHSFLNDLAWGLAMVPLVAFAAHQGGVAWFVAAWGGAGCVAAVLGMLQAVVVPRLSGTRTWLAQQRELGARYLVENFSMGAVTQLRIFSLGVIAGLPAVGSVRAAELLLGPWLAVVSGLSMVAVPEAARALRRSARALVVFCTAMGFVQAVGVAAWGLSILFLLPDSLGSRVLGSLWEPATSLILPTTVAFLGIGFMNGAGAGLRALAAARRSMRVTLWCAGLYLTGGVAGAWADGARGSAWGVAAATVTGAGLWWWQFRAGVRDLDRCRTGGDETERERTGRAAPPTQKFQPEMKATPS